MRAARKLLCTATRRRPSGATTFALLAMWLLGIVAIAAVLELQSRLDTARQTQIVIGDLTALVEKAPGIPFRLGPNGGSTAAAGVDLTFDARRFAAAVDELSELQSHDGAQVEQIRSTGARYYATIRAILDFVAAGDLMRAGQLVVGLAVGEGLQVELRRLLVAQNVHSGREAAEARRLAEAGSAVAVLVTLVAFTLSLLRATRSRRRAESLALANEVLLEQSRNEEERYRELFENANEPIATVDMEWTVTAVNAAFADALGYAREEIVGAKLADFLTAEGQALSAAYRDRKLSGLEESSRYEQTFVAKDGRHLVFEVSTRLIFENGRAVGVQGMCRDVTARKEAEAQLLSMAELNHHQANHDQLTSLPNRLAFQREIERAIAGARSRGPFAVALIDVDRFKQVNDALGHGSGDALLRELAGRLRNAVVAPGVVARLGGDEFGVLLPGGSDGHGGWADAIARIKAAFDKPHVVDGAPIMIEGSIGIAVHPTHGTGVDELLRRADVAMYVAKGGGRGHAVYSAGEDPNDAEKLTLLGELRRAISERELVLHFQPIIDVATGRTTKVEALMRWLHPTRGLLSPSDFIPLAESTGLVRPLTLYALDEAVRRCKRWQEEGHDVGVSVNLSTRNLAEADLVSLVLTTLAERELDPSRLTLEITESAVMADPVGTKRMLSRLSEHGVRVALDDFGAGFTSLSHLRDLPIHEIKIDRSFVTRLLTHTHDAAITRSMILMSHDLDLDVVAEGVEDAPSLDALDRLGCDFAQGFHLGRPLTADDVSVRLDAEASLADERAA